MFYQSYSRIHIKLRQPAIFETDGIGKSYIPQKKALNNGRWKKFQNWKYLYHERLQTSFSESIAFSIRWAGPSPDSKKLLMPKESFLGIKVCTGKNHINIQYGALIRDQLLLCKAK